MYFLLLLSILTIGTGCNSSSAPEPSCALQCEKVEELVSVKAKVFYFKGSDQYILTTDSVSLKEPGYIIGSSNILIPCTPLDNQWA